MRRAYAVLVALALAVALFARSAVGFEVSGPWTANGGADIVVSTLDKRVIVGKLTPLFAAALDSLQSRRRANSLLLLEEGLGKLARKEFPQVSVSRREKAVFDAYTAAFATPLPHEPAALASYAWTALVHRLLNAKRDDARSLEASKAHEEGRQQAATEAKQQAAPEAKQSVPARKPIGRPSEKTYANADALKKATVAYCTKELPKYGWTPALAEVVKAGLVRDPDGSEGRALRDLRAAIEQTARLITSSDEKVSALAYRAKSFLGKLPLVAHENSPARTRRRLLAVLDSDEAIAASTLVGERLRPTRAATRALAMMSLVSGFFPKVPRRASVGDAINAEVSVLAKETRPLMLAAGSLVKEQLRELHGFSPKRLLTAVASAAADMSGRAKGS